MKGVYKAILFLLVVTAAQAEKDSGFNRFLLSLDTQLYSDGRGNEILFSAEKHVRGDFILPYDHEWFFEHGRLYQFLLRTLQHGYMGVLKVFVLDCSLWPQKTEEGPYGFITELEIASEFRRKGHARDLMKEAYKLIAAHNLPLVALEVRDNDLNIPAIKLYETEGFVQDKEWTTKYIMTKKMNH